MEHEFPSAPLAVTRTMRSGQDLQSFLELVAGDNSLSVSELLRAHGEKAPQGPYDLLSGPEIDWARIGHALSIGAESLRSATFHSIPFEAAIAERWINPEAYQRQGHRRDQRLRRSGARYCPACLVGRDGAWKLRWYLPTAVACTKHLVLLVDACPECGRVPHSGEKRLTAVPADANRCQHPKAVSKDAKRPGRPARCGTDLTSAAARGLDHGHPVIAAQQMVDHVLTALVSGEQLTACGLSVPATVVLNALVRIVNWLSMWQVDLADAVAAHLTPGRRISASTGYRLSEHAAGPGPIFAAHLSAAQYGVQLAAAADILSAPHLEAAAQALERYEDLKHSPPAHGAPFTRTFIRQQDRSDSALATAITLTRDRDTMKVADQLSYRMYSLVPRKPNRIGAPVAWPAAESSLRNLEPKHLPQSLWSSITVTLPRLAQKDTGAQAVSSSLILARMGTHTRWFELAAQFQLSSSSARTVSAHLQRLAEDDLLDHTLTLLDQYWDVLACSPPPIDYDQRRWVFRRPPALDADLDRQITRLDVARTETTRHFVSVRLWETLTGSDARFTALGPLLAPGRKRTEYRAFHNRFGAPLRHAIESAATRALETAGIDEPAQWEPSIDGRPSRHRAVPHETSDKRVDPHHRDLHQAPDSNSLVTWYLEKGRIEEPLAFGRFVNFVQRWHRSFIDPATGVVHPGASQPSSYDRDDGHLLIQSITPYRPLEQMWVQDRTEDFPADAIADAAAVFDEALHADFMLFDQLVENAVNGLPSTSTGQRRRLEPYRVAR